MLAVVEIIREAGEPWWAYIAAAAVVAIPSTIGAIFAIRTRGDTARKLVPEVRQINDAVNNHDPGTPAIAAQVGETAIQVHELHDALVCSRANDLKAREAAGREPERIEGWAGEHDRPTE